MTKLTHEMSFLSLSIIDKILVATNLIANLTPSGSHMTRLGFRGQIIIHQDRDLLNVWQLAKTVLQLNGKEIELPIYRAHWAQM